MWKTDCDHIRCENTITLYGKYIIVQKDDGFRGVYSQNYDVLQKSKKWYFWLLSHLVRSKIPKPVKLKTSTFRTKYGCGILSTFW